MANIMKCIAPVVPVWAEKIELEWTAAIVGGYGALGEIPTL